MMSHYVDVHTHLTHERFVPDLEHVIARAKLAGLGAIVVNGLEPRSNRQILAMSQQDPLIKAALGIYPLNAICGILPDPPPFPVEVFDVDQEIEFIRAQALSGRISAVGECGLDAHWVGSETFAEQERVFGKLIEVAVAANIPVIVHTRRLEKRAMEILEFFKAKKVDFHCFGGKSSLAIKAAENADWCFSIPANARKNESFGKLLRGLPREKILTETDAPYLAPEKATRNEPQNVVGTVAYFAELRSIPIEEARDLVWANYQRLFDRAL
jgi:TatD DNase family protein